jgi:hypothetical protein
MAVDPVLVNTDTGSASATNVPIAAETINGNKFQWIKFGFGADGAFTLVHSGAPMPVSDAAAATLLASVIAALGSPEQAGATKPISAASLPLPTGAATQATLASILTALGSPEQAGATKPISAASLPLPTGAATQTTLAALLTALGSPEQAGATKPISAAALPLPSGASTSALQTSGNTSLNNIDVDLGAVADAAQTDETQSATLIALIKGILNKVKNLSVGGTVVSPTAQLPIKLTPFSITTSITRPANTTVYSIGTIVNANAASTLPAFDLTALIGATSRTVQINNAYLMGSTADVTKLQVSLCLYNASTITGQTLTDNTAWAPTHAETLAKMVGCLESITTPQPIGSVEYRMAMTEISRQVVTASDGKIYFAPITLNSATPSSAEVFTFKIEGYLL